MQRNNNKFKESKEKMPLLHDDALDKKQKKLNSSSTPPRLLDSLPLFNTPLDPFKFSIFGGFEPNLPRSFHPQDQKNLNLPNFNNFKKNSK